MQQKIQLIDSWIFSGIPRRNLGLMEKVKLLYGKIALNQYFLKTRKKV